MATTSPKVGILGCMGRMGQALTDAVREEGSLTLVAGSEVSVHPLVGGVIPGTDVMITDSAASVFEAADVVLDFTPPGNTADHAALAAETGTALIVGTTGLTDEDHAALDAAGGSAVIVQAGNYSLGVNLLVALVKDAAAKLDTGFDIEIVETHHKHKIDAPSGTAIMLGEAAAEGRGVALETVRTPAREGLTGERIPGSIGFSAVRGGGVIGDHDVMFMSGSERLTLSHRAENRRLFADGAVKAAVWAVAQKPGRYSMKDVLGL
ncbi:4-hydroxy-tetrahydrodipicolinate reductase [Kordiimonas marina]|uniref:4-hydroxy-tetrahydrodipicolinate reductase n=1 Tax=Kordiimonas marina TaxID=2872312 RepID=UPI001FF5703C|nr:4-hydroxy-tetrahydrodipicolinate reductase [Kordiimonas marina]MCJ9429847.1 4-hydroxy-tetrahydrodipicolinate reductase [Kordiimonas marina]